MKKIEPGLVYRTDALQKNITSLSLLNWDDLKFFLEVARTRKASLAAKRLSVDYTTVSRRISSLEASLGTLLFEKSRNNGFVLTAEGQRPIEPTAEEQVAKMDPDGDGKIGGSPKGGNKKAKASK